MSCLVEIQICFANQSNQISHLVMKLLTDVEYFFVIHSSFFENYVFAGTNVS